MSTAKTIGRHVVFAILVIVILSAIAIWFGLGPVVQSAGTT